MEFRPRWDFKFAQICTTIQHNGKIDHISAALKSRRCRTVVAFATINPEAGEFPNLHTILLEIVQEAIRRPIWLYQERKQGEFRGCFDRAFESLLEQQSLKPESSQSFIGSYG